MADVQPTAPGARCGLVGGTREEWLDHAPLGRNEHGWLRLRDEYV